MERESRNGAAIPSEPDSTSTRRAFLQGTGITFAIGSAGLLTAWPDPSSDTRAQSGSAASTEVSPNIWVTIGADDVITIRYGGTEMGQGTMTSLPVVLAEELDADWDNVRVEIVPTHDPRYGNPGAFGYYGFPILYSAGSTTLWGYFDAMRQAGAQARRFLIDTLAREWDVPVSELATEPSRVVHPPSGRSRTYGEIAAIADAPEALPEIDASDYKDPSEYRLIGKDVPRIDVPAKADGSAQFGIDAQVPGMVYASILRAPVEGESALEVDDAAARAIDGVTDIVSLSYGVAVVGATVESTLWGKDALEVTWSESSPFRATDLSRDLDDYEAKARDLAFSTDNPYWQNVGDIDAALGSAERVIEAVYRADPAYHAQMEPMNATASVSADGKSAEIWVSTQTQSLSVMGAADALDTAIDNITLHPMYVGGGYGRRAEFRQKYIDDALFVSRQVGKPVKVIWSREDDIKDGAFRPLAAQYLRAGLDAQGRIIAFHQRVATPTVLGYMNEPRWELSRGRDGIAMNGAQTSRYDIPNIRAEHLIVDRCTRVCAWRGVGTSYTRFANESFIDEIAHDQGQDPLEFRIALAHDNEAALGVLREVGQMADWPRIRQGRSLGVALSDYGGRSVAAGVAEVSVNEDTGDIAVHKYWMVIDAGLIVSPRNTRAQMEGNVVYGISNALKERISFRGGAVDQSNFFDYQVMRMNEVPEIEVKAIANTKPPSGVGELGLATTGAAIANAVFAATGARVRELPLTPDRVLRALRG